MENLRASNMDLFGVYAYRLSHQL